MRQRIERRRRQPGLAAAAGLGLLALLPPLAYYQQRAGTTATAAAELDRRLAPVRWRQARNAEQLRDLEEARGRMAVLERVLGAKEGWRAFLADLQEQLSGIEDVWIDRMTRVPGRGAGGPEGSRSAAGKGRTERDGLSPDAGLRLRLRGRLLDAGSPQEGFSPGAFERMKRLLAGLAASPFVAAVESERFDRGPDGLLHFDVTLVLDRQGLL
jgi:hypothetical protein